METTSSLKSVRHFPWATSALTLVALGLNFVPAESGKLVFLRPALLHGEWWRAWTGHLVHFGTSHLLWNLALFLPVGIWLERLRPGPTRLFYTVAPAIISLLLLMGDAELERYAGLSGLAAGQIAMLAVLQLRAGPSDARLWWLAALALIAVKIAWEWHTGAPLLVQGAADIRSVPLAHLAGAVSGAAFGWAVGRRQAN